MIFFNKNSICFLLFQCGTYRQTDSVLHRQSLQLIVLYFHNVTYVFRCPPSTHAYTITIVYFAQVFLTWPNTTHCVQWKTVWECVRMWVVPLNWVDSFACDFRMWWDLYVCVCVSGCLYICRWDMTDDCSTSQYGWQWL